MCTYPCCTRGDAKVTGRIQTRLADSKCIPAASLTFLGVSWVPLFHAISLPQTPSVSCIPVHICRLGSVMGCISLAQVRIPPSPRGKYRFSNKGSTSDDFSGARRGCSGAGVSLSFPRGEAALPRVLFVPSCTWLPSWLASCVHAHPPLPRANVRVKQLR